MGSYFDTIINFYKLDNCRLVIQELSKPCLSRFSLIRLRALKCLRCLSGEFGIQLFPLLLQLLLLFLFLLLHLLCTSTTTACEFGRVERTDQLLAWGLGGTSHSFTRQVPILRKYHLLTGSFLRNGTCKTCFSYFLVQPLCQIEQWCWWRGFSKAASSNPLDFGLCPTSAPHNMLTTFWQLQPCLFCKVNYGTSFMEKDRQVLWLPVFRCTDTKSFISGQVVVCRRGRDNS